MHVSIHPDQADAERARGEFLASDLEPTEIQWAIVGRWPGGLDAGVNTHKPLDA